MCGRISQFSDIREYVSTLGMEGALLNSVGDVPLERYYVAPSTQVALLHLQDETLHADLVGLAAALGQGEIGPDQRQRGENGSRTILQGDLAAPGNHTRGQLVRIC